MSSHNHPRPRINLKSVALENCDVEKSFCLQHRIMTTLLYYFSQHKQSVNTNKNMPICLFDIINILTNVTSTNKMI